MQKIEDVVSKVLEAMRMRGLGEYTLKCVNCSIYRPIINAEMILPVLFRMKLCCEVRLKKALNLLTEDVDLNTGDTFIRNSKRGKDRHLIVSEDICHLCAQYDRLVGKSQWFFQHWEGGKLPTT